MFLYDSIIDKQGLKRQKEKHGMIEKLNTWRVTITTTQNYEEINYFNNRDEVEYFLQDYARFINLIESVEHKSGYQWNYMNLDRFNKIVRDAKRELSQKAFDKMMGSDDDE